MQGRPAATGRIPSGAAVPLSAWSSQDQLGSLPSLEYWTGPVAAPPKASRLPHDGIEIAVTWAGDGRRALRARGAPAGHEPTPSAPGRRPSRKVAAAAEAPAREGAPFGPSTRASEQMGGRRQAAAASIGSAGPSAPRCAARAPHPPPAAPLMRSGMRRIVWHRNPLRVEPAAGVVAPVPDRPRHAYPARVAQRPEGPLSVVGPATGAAVDQSWQDRQSGATAAGRDATCGRMSAGQTRPRRAPRRPDVQHPSSATRRPHPAMPATRRSSTPVSPSSPAVASSASTIAVHPRPAGARQGRRRRPGNGGAGGRAGGTSCIAARHGGSKNGAPAARHAPQAQAAEIRAAARPPARPRIGRRANKD